MAAAAWVNPLCAASGLTCCCLGPGVWVPDFLSCAELTARVTCVCVCVCRTGQGKLGCGLRRTPAEEEVPLAASLPPLATPRFQQQPIPGLGYLARPSVLLFLKVEKCGEIPLHLLTHPTAGTGRPKLLAGTQVQGPLGVQVNKKPARSLLWGTSLPNHAIPPSSTLGLCGRERHLVRLLCSAGVP